MTGQLRLMPGGALAALVALSRKEESADVGNRYGATASASGSPRRGKPKTGRAAVADAKQALPLTRGKPLLYEIAHESRGFPVVVVDRAARALSEPDGVGTSTGGEPATHLYTGAAAT